mmetsp:Transcript_7857/g.23373  ORF Transcript_7857/g.23373 Transcript_7857/m.23373 type:complete len:1494 (+) Transcript_7857:164-4645(+)
MRLLALLLAAVATAALETRRAKSPTTAVKDAILEDAAAARAAFSDTLKIYGSRRLTNWGGVCRSIGQRTACEGEPCCSWAGGVCCDSGACAAPADDGRHLQSEDDDWDDDGGSWDDDDGSGSYDDDDDGGSWDDDDDSGGSDEDDEDDDRSESWDDEDDGSGSDDDEDDGSESFDDDGLLDDFCWDLGESRGKEPCKKHKCCEWDEDYCTGDQDRCSADDVPDDWEDDGSDSDEGDDSGDDWDELDTWCESVGERKGKGACNKNRCCRWDDDFCRGDKDRCSEDDVPDGWDEDDSGEDEDEDSPLRDDFDDFCDRLDKGDCKNHKCCDWNGQCDSQRDLGECDAGDLVPPSSSSDDDYAERVGEFCGRFDGRKDACASLECCSYSGGDCRWDGKPDCPWTEDDLPCGRGGEECSDSRPCCDAERTCYEKNDDASFCREDCPDGWKCDPTPRPTPKPVKPSPKPTERQCAPGGEECSDSFPCCDSGRSCFEKEGDVSICRKACPDGWLCSTPRPTKKPTPRPTERQCAVGGEECSDDFACCDDERVCFDKNDKYSECRKECPDGWLCDTPRPTKKPTPRPSPRPTEEQCAEDGETCSDDLECCHSSRTCFRKNRDTSVCRLNCPDGWLCQTPRPTKKPTPLPSPRPTKAPKTPRPTSTPAPRPRTPQPVRPTPQPVRETPRPTPKPSPVPTPRPSRKPTRPPAPEPSRKPTPGPSQRPTPEPTVPAPKPQDAGSGFDGCVDDPNWFYAGDDGPRGCDDVARDDTARRCGRASDAGVPATEACCATCEALDVKTPRPTAEATPRPARSPSFTELEVALRGVDAGSFNESPRAARVFLAACGEALDRECRNAEARYSDRRRLQSGLAIVAFEASGDDARAALAAALRDGSFAAALEARQAQADVLRDASVDVVGSLDRLDEPSGSKKGSKSSGPSATTIAIAIAVALLACGLVCGALFVGGQLGGGVPLTPGQRETRRRFRPWSGRRAQRDVEAGLASEASDEATGGTGSVPHSESETPSPQDSYRSEEPPKASEYRGSGDLSLWRRQGRVFTWGAAPAVAWSEAAERFVRRLPPGSGLELVDAAEGFPLGDADAGLREALAEACAWPMARRVEAFRERLEGLRGHWQRDGRLTVKVRRETALGSCYDQLAGAPDEQWRWPWFFEIEGEAGLDAGGLSREVLRLAATELFSIEVGLFTHSADDAMTYTVQDDATVAAQEGVGLAMLTFAGKLVGKALLDGIHLDAQLNSVLLKHVCGVPVGLQDLQDLDWPLFSSLSQLKDVDVTHLALTFSVETRTYGSLATRELVPGGGDMAVTNENKDEFISLRLREALYEATKKNLEAFLRGVYAVIPQELFLLVSSRDVALMLSGTPTIDVDEWAAATHYRGAFARAGADHEVVRWFWEALRELAADRRAHLLQWATGHARVPIQGWDHLMGRDGVVHPFTLTSVELSQAVYPRAHTCFNRIDVPLFESKAELVEAFTYVLDLSDATFSMD